MRKNALRFSSISVFRAASQLPKRLEEAWVVVSLSQQTLRQRNYCERVLDLHFLVEERNIVQSFTFTRDIVIFKSFQSCWTTKSNRLLNKAISDRKNGCLSSTDVRHGVGGGRRYNFKFNVEPAALILEGEGGGGTGE